MFAELAVVVGFQYLPDHLLKQLVRPGGQAQWPELALLLFRVNLSDGVAPAARLQNRT